MIPTYWTSPLSRLTLETRSDVATWDGRIRRLELGPTLVPTLRFGPAFTPRALGLNL